MNIAELRSGVEVAKIQLDSDIFKAELRNIPQEVSEIVRHFYERHCQSITIKDQLLSINFSRSEERTQFVDWFKNLELEGNVKKGIKIELVDDSRDKMKKVAKGILKIRFWAAERRSRRN